MLPTHCSPRRALIAPQPKPPLAYIHEVRLLPPSGHTPESAAELPIPDKLPPALLRVLASIALEYMEAQNARVVDSPATKPKQ